MERRDFLKSLAALAVAPKALSVLAEQQPMQPIVEAAPEPPPSLFATCATTSSYPLTYQKVAEARNLLEQYYDDSSMWVAADRADAVERACRLLGGWS